MVLSPAKAKHIPSDPGDGWDESRSAPDSARALVKWLGGRDLDALCGGVRRELHERGVVFHSDGGDSDFVVDAVPRVIGGHEWDALAHACAQRVRALECFVADVYGARRIVAAGVVSDATIDGSSYHEPQMAGLAVARWLPVAGLDLVRGADGELRVLEDNVRTPSGLAYVLAARDAIAPRIPVPGGVAVRSIADAPVRLGHAITAAAPPTGAREPFAVLLTDGEGNSAYYEHVTLAAHLELPIVRPHELTRHDGALWLDSGSVRRRVDVVYRRTDADRLFTPQGGCTPLGELLLEPLRAGRLAVVNAFGAGVADDKLVHSHTEDMVRFYLGQEPAIASVPTYDPQRPETLEMIMDRIGDLVVKPRDGHGGRGVMIGPRATGGERERMRAALAAAPQDFVAQELVFLSTHPTVCEGQLQPRHVDLRVFVLSSGERVEVIPGGLTRVALEAGELVVNSSRNGGAKDTWVLD